MKKQNAADILAERDILKIREHILTVAYLEQADATYRHRDGRDTYVWKAYRLNGAAGGYLVGTFNGFANHGPSMLYVERLDTAIEQVQHRASSFIDCGMCAAVHFFTNKRFELTRVAS